MNKNDLKLILEQYYSKDSIKSLFIGRMKPSLEKAIELHERHDIPLDAWKDIKSFITSSETMTQNPPNENYTKDH